MEVRKPIKRSRELAPYSRDHHEGLQFVWKLKQGLVNHTALETLGRYCRWFWENHLSAHFQSEEEVLIRYLPADHPLVNQMRGEHAQIRELLSSIAHSPDAASLKKLCTSLTNHIRFEERQLFLFAENTLTTHQLHEIYQQLSKDKSCYVNTATSGWRDEFWITRK